MTELELFTKLVIFRLRRNYSFQIALSRAAEYFVIAYNRAVDDDKEKEDGSKDGDAKEDKKDSKDLAAKYKSRISVVQLKGKLNTCEAAPIQSLVSDIALSWNNKMFVASSWDGTATVWSIDCKYQTAFHVTDSFLHHVAITSDGQHIASSDYGRFSLWKMPRDFDGDVISNGRCESLAFDGRGVYLACGTEGGNLILADAGQGKVIGEIRAGEGKIVSVSFVPTGELLAAASESGVVSVWDTLSQKPYSSFRAFGESDWVSFRNDGKYCGSEDVEKYLRMELTKEGVLWNTTEQVVFDAATTAELREECMPTGE